MISTDPARFLNVNTVNARSAVVVHSSDGSTFYRIDGVDYRPVNYCPTCGVNGGSVCLTAQRRQTTRPHRDRVLEVIAPTERDTADPDEAEARRLGYRDADHYRAAPGRTTADQLHAATERDTAADGPCRTCGQVRPMPCVCMSEHLADCEDADGTDSVCSSCGHDRLVEPTVDDVVYRAAPGRTTADQLDAALARVWADDVVTDEALAHPGAAGFTREDLVDEVAELVGGSGMDPAEALDAFLEGREENLRDDADAGNVR